jgi:predicted flap endonuclease-1-like 5' DNA nuclease
MRFRYFLLGLLVGIYLGWRWFSLESERPVTQPVSEPTPFPPKPKTRSKPDPLIEIDGIGPTFVKALNSIGIWSFEELASQDADVLAARLPARITAERIRRDGWIEQARARARQQ